MMIRHGRQQVNENLMNHTLMNRAMGLSMVILAYLPLNADCSGGSNATPKPQGQQLSRFS